MVGIGDKCSAHRAHIFPATHLLKLPYAKLLVDFPFRIAQQGEREGIFPGKFRMACGGILADSDDFISESAKIGIAVAERACLGCAARCIVFRIEIYNKRLAGEVGCLYFFPSASYPSSSGILSPISIVGMGFIR